ncbi:hypothetical protein CR513_29268, partial [Mucuna pruriens]
MEISNLQIGTIDEYVEAFEVLMAQVPLMPEEQHMEVLAFEPPNQHKLISVSQLTEQKLTHSSPQNVTSGWRGTQQPKSITSWVNSVSSGSKAQGGHPNHSTSTTGSSGSYEMGSKTGQAQVSNSHFRGRTQNLSYQ